MNRVRLLGAGAAALGIIGSAQAQESVTSSFPRGDSVISGVDEASSSVEVSVVNGEVSVKVDGKEIEADRLQITDGKIVVLDDDGKPMQDIALGGGGAWHRAVAGDGGRFRVMRQDGADPFNRAFELLQDDGNRVRLRRMHDGAGEWDLLVPDDDSFGFFDAGDAPPRVVIGIQMEPPPPPLVKHLHLDPDACTMITGVYEGLPAHTAGLGEFDVIIHVEGADDAGTEAIRKAIGAKEAGETIAMRVIQAGKPISVELELQAYDAEQIAAAPLIGTAAGPQNWVQDFAEVPFEFEAGGDRRVFVAPEWDIDFSGIEPGEIHGHILEHIRTGEGEHGIRVFVNPMTTTPGEPGEPKGDVADRIDRLNERIRELERLIQELVEDR